MSHSTEFGHLTITNKYYEQDYSYQNAVHTIFELQLTNNTEVAFILGDTNIYEKVSSKLFPTKSQSYISSFKLSSNQLKLVDPLLRQIDFDKYRISSLQLINRGEHQFLNLTVYDEFAKTRNAEQYIELIEKLISEINHVT